ncbi:MAG: extracellular solute-binding protein [Patescibacteria group bacterium]|jgi:ABC-type glycerol-3-phosphate transport system substrate-binding protein
MNSRKLLIIGILIGIIIIPFIIFAVGVLRRPPQSLPSVTLSVWMVEDEEEALAPIMNAYANVHRNVKFSVTVQRAETYSQELRDAWAKGAGPDIFTIPATWAGQYEDFITPLPAVMRVPYYEDRKFLWKTDSVIEFRNDAGLTVRNVQEQFVDAVAKMVVRQEEIYGLPLAMDTLVLYYNRDLLNSAQIPTPATTWQGLVSQIEQTQQLSVIDQTGALIQSAVALGTAENIPNATDILALLMMQNGTLMTDETERTITFNKTLSEGFSPGAEASRFYTDFARIGKSAFSWNDDQANALDAFINGNLVYFIGYGAHAAEIERRAGTLNWGMSEMLHVHDDGTDNFQQRQRLQINMPNYWMWSVAKQSEEPALAWSFIQYAANAGRVPSYLEKTGKISALRTVLEQQVNDPNLSILARQALSARHWYYGENAVQTETLLKDFIDNINKGIDIQTALTTTAKQIQLTFERR